MDRYAHNDGSRECRPVGDDSATADLFDGTPAAPPRVKSRNELNSAQQATFDRLVANPVALLEVNVRRIEQVTKHGHSDESDAEMSFVQMLRHTRERLDDAIEFAQNARSCADRARRNGYLVTARGKIAIAAAMALANMDRLIFEIESDA